MIQKYMGAKSHEQKNKTQNRGGADPPQIQNGIGAHYLPDSGNRFTNYNFGAGILARIFFIFFSKNA